MINSSQVRLVKKKKSKILYYIDRFSRTSVRLMSISTWLVVKVSEYPLTSLGLYYMKRLCHGSCFLFSLCGGTVGAWQLLLRVDNKETSFCLSSWCCALLPGPSWSNIIPQIRAISGEYLQLIWMVQSWYSNVKWLSKVDIASCVFTVGTFYNVV